MSGMSAYEALKEAMGAWGGESFFAARTRAMLSVMNDLYILQGEAVTLEEAIAGLDSLVETARRWSGELQALLIPPGQDEHEAIAAYMLKKEVGVVGPEARALLRVYEVIKAKVGPAATIAGVTKAFTGEIPEAAELFKLDLVSLTETGCLHYIA